MKVSKKKKKNTVWNQGLHLQAFHWTKPNCDQMDAIRHRATAGLIAKTPAPFKAASALSAPREKLLGPAAGSGFAFGK